MIRARVLVLSALACSAAAGARAPLLAQAPADSAVAHGRRIFEAVCSGCHSLEPPAKQAPPMANVAHRYRMMTASRAELAARVSAWVPDPHADRSLMPPRALQHWTLMPALPLAPEDLRTVGHFVAFLAYDTATARGRGMGGARGMGAGHQHGRHMQHDTTAVRN